MATTTAHTSRRINLAGSNRPRRPVHPARKRLALAMVLVIIGSFLPWLYVGGMPVVGIRGGGLWTFYAAMLGLAGVLLPFPRIGGGHALVMAAAAIALPAWQIGHVLSLVGFGGWMPGPGLVMVFFGGIFAAVAGFGLLRQAAPAGD